MGFQVTRNFLPHEAYRLKATDPDYAIRDLLKTVGRVVKLVVAPGAASASDDAQAGIT